jgi:hypothetical protein
MMFRVCSLYTIHSYALLSDEHTIESSVRVAMIFCCRVVGGAHTKWRLYHDVLIIQ